MGTEEGDRVWDALLVGGTCDPKRRGGLPPKHGGLSKVRRMRGGLPPVWSVLPQPCAHTHLTLRDLQTKKIEPLRTHGCFFPP